MKQSSRAVQERKEILYIFCFNFFLCCIAYRLYSLFTIIQTGGLLDLRGYYQIASGIVTGSIQTKDIIQTTMGPPFVVIPFLPLTFFQFTLANYILTLLNIIGFFITFYLLWKKYVKNISSLFWFFTGLLFFTLPVSYGLGMGNPMGIVTLGCYALVIFSDYKKLSSGLITIATWLKIFPFMSIPAYIVARPKDEKIRVSIYISFIILAVVSFLLVPKDAWGLYIQQFFQQYLHSTPDTSIYNQSFLSSLYRIGLPMKFLFIPYIIVVVSFTMYLLRRFYTSSTSREVTLLFSTVLLLAFFLLIHPFPWQYYFAIFIPFLFVQIGKKRYLYIIPLLLLSLDGNKISASQVKSFLDSSQFLGTVVMVGLMQWYTRQKML